MSKLQLSITKNLKQHSVQSCTVHCTVRANSIGTLLAKLNLPQVFILLLPLFFVACAAIEPMSSPTKAGATNEIAQLIEVNQKQGAAEIYQSYQHRLTPENCRIEISLKEQRARIFADQEIAISTPISSGIKGRETPIGQFSILEKKEYHESTLYGDYVDEAGKAILQGVSSRRVPAPEGTKWKGTPVPYWQRLNWQGIGMHVGKLPGHPASHGCIRYPAEVMPMIYQKTKIGTSVMVID